MTQFNLGAMVSQTNQVKQIPLEMLVPYHNHQFTLYDGERLSDMDESIRENGILTPIVVRPKIDGTYEILIGHNRWNCSKRVGKTSIPAIIKEGLSEEEAEMYVIESNLLQRGFGDLRTSEKAKVLAVRHSKMFHQGKRSDIVNELMLLENPNAEIQATEEHTHLSIEKEYGLKKDTIARLLRIDKLCQELKEWVDDGKLSIRAGVELSYIPLSVQDELYCILDDSENGKKIDMRLAKQIREAFADETQDTSILSEILLSEKDAIKPKPVKIKPKVYQKYFTPNTQAEEIEKTIDKALEMYFNNIDN